MAFFFPTPRLAVRPWRERDRPDLERMATDLDMMRFVTGRAWPATQIDEFLVRQQRHIRNHGICFGAVELGDRMQVAGVAGMQPLDGNFFKDDFELGWWIWKDFWGQGLALEAITPFIKHARNMGLKRVFAVIDPPNSASIRVAEKLGMRFDRTVSARETHSTREDKPASVYAMELVPAKD
ncbi:MAG TPA: GNAT family N-acetyltransferase [Wenzhouxiangellaceae bacterium]|nr:GNAT family N-acetyltransferase [Wenzhouxiangellaceae bacterium]